MRTIRFAIWVRPVIPGEPYGSLDIQTRDPLAVDVDPDGYTVEVDGTVMQAIRVSDAVTFTDLSVGDLAEDGQASGSR